MEADDQKSEHLLCTADKRSGIEEAFSGGQQQTHHLNSDNQRAAGCKVRHCSIPMHLEFATLLWIQVCCICVRLLVDKLIAAVNLSG